MTLLRIQGGTIYDPAHGIDGEVSDLWVEDGRIIATPTSPDVKPDRTLDAHGLVVMPAGVDMHCHIAGPKVNTARKMIPEEKRRSEPIHKTDLTRSGTIGSVPSTFSTGYLYAGLGYTTAFDAAIPPLTARHAHEEFADTPLLDKGFYVMMGNNHFLMERIKANEQKLVKDYIAWLLNATRGYACKLVNPGGVETWKQNGEKTSGLDQTIGHFDITPRAIIRDIARAADELQLPHAVHIHCNNLGLPGNYETTLETMKALEGSRGHLTHIQFHSYGGDPDDQSTFCSRVPELVDYVNNHENITVDVGQVMFGETTSMTGDGPLGHFLHKVTGNKWFSGDIEMEAGCGIVPIVYKNKSLIHSLQWAVGLEWYLMMEDPWRIAMSTDHPNGGSFLAYPEIIALLMDSRLREEMLQQVPAGLHSICTLPELTREYTLSEITIITRAAPARMLGLTQKGHLGPGADADITLYQPQDDKRKMFELPRYVLSAGEVIVDDGEIRKVTQGNLQSVTPDYDLDCRPYFKDWFEKHYTIAFDNFEISDEEPL
ncbi:Formyltransferase/hydrolase complex Fhc subunit A [Polystyrenella longa]|uniref:Formyltransferase/hydrolase complex Fhc subunit A n=1 Tax=Polystyrenella longa TaxID=2528007 RepID=A0A518CMK7_9PLAN|nr:formylmethanofuran dehydrogenase subunit A [Polystyrenella longa]QDU80459.1 Formyltransferase/hydrolase complex Fhc subunit A [Polystyrenella longa]